MDSLIAQAEARRESIQRRRSDAPYADDTVVLLNLVVELATILREQKTHDVELTSQVGG